MVFQGKPLELSMPHFRHSMQGMTYKGLDTNSGLTLRKMPMGWRPHIVLPYFLRYLWNSAALPCIDSTPEALFQTPVRALAEDTGLSAHRFDDVHPKAVKPLNLLMYWTLHNHCWCQSSLNHL